MTLLKNINEMAIRGPDYSAMADEWAVNFENKTLQDLESHKIIGNIDQYDVRQKGSYLSAWDKNTVVGIIKVDVVPDVYTVVDDLWVKKDLRGKRLLSKMFLFLKANGHKKLALGTTHSTDTQMLLKNNAFSGFKKSWVSHNGQIVPFEISTIDDFYGPGGWKLVLESPINVKKFIKEDSFMNSYESLVNILELNNLEDLEDLLD